MERQNTGLRRYDAREIEILTAVNVKPSITRRNFQSNVTLFVLLVILVIICTQRNGTHENER
jgi:hypothetical protein